MENINVLLIEDKKADAVFLENVLKSEGYRVWTVPNGREGVELIKNSSFAVVITELHIPGFSGIEIIQEALKARPNISVVVMTVYAFIGLAVEAMEAGAYGYITKPFNLSEIRVVVKRAIEKYVLLSSKQDKEQFAEMSVMDSLTGVYNRRFLKTYINNKIFLMNLIADKFSVLMIDIDHFKKYNDTFGHPAGDEVLRKACKTFVESLRKGDMVFRYGGEEFLLFLDNTDKKGALLVAERIRKAISLYLPTTVSLGISSFPEDGTELEELISSADKALYKAKETGRNKICVSERQR
jgi:diguanylate cyclase (GGDEF)-like protein